MKAGRNVLRRNQVFRRCQEESFTDGILSRPEAPHQRLIYYHGVSAVGLVMVVQGASFQQRNAHRAEITARHSAVLDVGNLVDGCGQWPVQSHEPLAPVLTPEGETGNGARCLDAGKLLDSRKQILKESNHARGCTDSPRIKVRIVRI